MSLARAVRLESSVQRGLARRDDDTDHETQCTARNGPIDRPVLLLSVSNPNHRCDQQTGLDPRNVEPTASLNEQCVQH